MNMYYIYHNNNGTRPDRNCSRFLAYLWPFNGFANWLNAFCCAYVSVENWWGRLKGSGRRRSVARCAQRWLHREMASWTEDIETGKHLFSKRSHKVVPYAMHNAELMCATHMPQCNTKRYEWKYTGNRSSRLQFKTWRSLSLSADLDLCMWCHAIGFDSIRMQSTTVCGISWMAICMNRFLHECHIKMV